MWGSCLHPLHAAQQTDPSRSPSSYLLLDCWLPHIHKQRIKLGPNLSSFTKLSTGVPQGCVLSPLLYFQYTNNSSTIHPSNNIKFADDTATVQFITGRDKSAYKDEMQQLAEWCSRNNPFLNATKTLEIILELRKKQSAEAAPIYVYGVCGERMDTFKFLNSIISEDLTWAVQTWGVVRHGSIFT